MLNIYNSCFGNRGELILFAKIEFTFLEKLDCFTSEQAIIAEVD